MKKGGELIMFITKEMLVEKNFYKGDIKWFEEQFPNGGNCQEVLDLSVKLDKLYFGEWVVQRFGPMDTVLEVDELTSTHNIIFAGSIIVKGNINVTRSLIAGKDIKAGGDIKIGWDIEAGGAIIAGGDIYSFGVIDADGNIEAGGSIKAGYIITSDNDIKAGKGIESRACIDADGDINASGNIKADGIIIAGKSIKTGGDIETTTGTIKAVLGIYARGDVKAKATPNNIVSGTFVFNNLDDKKGECSNYE